ncbi:family 1 glycosylhydrolase [Azohydromonas lata]|uniref:dTDP-4-dehydrorhamnose reductase n=1 Tax=Azohydromonas lata TaxID=45677 RepID=A0ABU5IGH6_9BURK|nr:family 1 glycosylhydrolase [Azohydromonas lata]MDZ5457755.1 family 1 glycosylhydrolase [Azohydromonas lata]
MAGLELWAAPEATVNRIGDRYIDQLECSGFNHRLDDLDRLASLGARRVRFPILWERTEQADGTLDFTWADARMARLRELGLEPIVGLLHHGSGPRHTSLLDDAFPGKLAAFARAVAERYPWATLWTPVNEPVTTARFSGLYGIWYPHRADGRSFVRALMNEVMGTAAAMRALREAQPAARLVQTEDIGFIHSTPPLQYQARHDNARRWLALDLLAGRVDEHHPLRGYLLDHGATPRELDALREAPEADMLIGVNHYITSERFLDHRLERYPAHLHGGNGRDRYVDTEAVRVLGAHVGGFEARLREVAARYPGHELAITEVHIGCTREEQMRWLAQAWSAAQALRSRGVKLRALTLWAAFGTFDWDSLLTRPRGHYESGAWDVRGPTPRETALAALARDLAAGREPSHPVLQGAGWWHREERHVYLPHGEVQSRRCGGPPVLIVGARGTLGQAFARLCRQRGLPYRLLRREELDITRGAAVRALLQSSGAWAVINAAGYVRVDDAEDDPRQWHDNALGPMALARACGHAGVPVLTFSSDLVFDGRQQRPYRESDPVNPLNAYGRAKARAERALARVPGSLVVRTSAFFGPWDRHNFLHLGLERLARGETWTAPDDQIVSPTYVPDLVNACLDLLVDGQKGLWHVANRGALSWYALACAAAEAAGHPCALVRAVDSGSLGLRAARPPYSALTSERGELTPRLEDALQRFLAEAPQRLHEGAPAPAFGL